MLHCIYFHKFVEGMFSSLVVLRFFFGTKGHVGSEFKRSRVLSSLLPHMFLHESVMKTSLNHHDSMSFNLILCVPWIFGASSKVTLSAFCVVISQRFSSILNLGVVQFFSIIHWTNTTRSFQNSFQITRRNPSNTESKQRQRSWIDLHLCQDLAISQPWSKTKKTNVV